MIPQAEGAVLALALATARSLARSINPWGPKALRELAAMTLQNVESALAVLKQLEGK